MIQYLAVEFWIKDKLQKEVLNFYLEQAGVESIEDRESSVVGYFTKLKWPKSEQEMAPYIAEQKIKFHVSEVENRNWNAEWEASFEPVNINDFCYVRAPFHLASPNRNIIDLILEPRMAFGTAHHATTFMMMAAMQHIDFEGKKVFDYGCGTAILSVLAENLGAADIYAIDIEEAAIENAIYNAEINACSKIRCAQATLEEVEIDSYDFILANINRQVLLDSAPKLIEYLVKGGYLLISGILIRDEAIVKQTYLAAGFKYLSTSQKGEWKCIQFTK